MIKLIEARNFRSLKYISQPMGAFHVLIGANATGKTTFLDVIKFMADIVNLGIDKAVFARASYFDELTFAGKGGDIELAIEAELPIVMQKNVYGNHVDTIRYEIKIGTIPETGAIAVKNEHLMVLLKRKARTFLPGFSELIEQKDWVFNKELIFDYETITSKNSDGNAMFLTNVVRDNKKEESWITFQLGTKKTAIGNLPEDETMFPAANWFKSYLQNGVDLFILDSQVMQKPSPVGQSIQFKTDGSNLPWVIEDLRKKNPKKFRWWVEHIKTAFPDIEEIITIDREEDRNRYIKIRYNNGMEVPSWLVSDGTLRLLALTIPAYLSDITGIFLFEEPENGIHPQAIETVFASLSSIYDGQVLLATHSTVILGLVKAEQILCFSKTPEGVTEIVLGTNHPKLRNWKGNPNLNLLFASGILS